MFAVSVHAGGMRSASALPATEAQAIKLFQAGRFRDAARLYEGMRGEASAHSCNLGLCYAKLSDAASAVKAIESCLEGGAPWMGGVTRADYHELLSRLRARIASRQPATFPGGDGDPIAKGVRLIEVNAPPAEPAPAVVAPVPAPAPVVAPAATPPVAPIPPKAPVPTPAPEVPPAPVPSVPVAMATPAPPAKTWTPPVYQDLAKPQVRSERRARSGRGGGNEAVIVTGIPGVLGTGIGFGFLMHSRALSQEIAALEVPPPGLGAITPEMSAAVARLRDERDTANRRAKISFVVGGVGLFASMIAAVTADNDDDDGPSLVLGPGSAGIAGRF
ncbi:MAG TPA: hypothetical protein VGF45_18700 [Polyangia bacterium]